jgi:hypothetical protein
MAHLALAIQQTTTCFALLLLSHQPVAMTLLNARHRSRRVPFPLELGRNVTARQPEPLESVPETTKPRRESPRRFDAEAAYLPLRPLSREDAKTVLALLTRRRRTVETSKHRTGEHRRRADDAQPDAPSSRVATHEAFDETM